MEDTSTSVTWSNRPEPDLIGVSVFQGQKRFSLRFHLRTAHLDKLNNPKTVGIRGSAQNGFILTPDTDGGVKPSRVASTNLFYVMQTVKKFDISKRERRTVWMRPEFENGQLRVPPLPPAWIAVEDDFMPRDSASEKGEPEMVRGNGKDHAIGHSTSSATVPPPKPAIPSHQLPTDSDLTRLQSELGQKLEECRSIIHQMEQRSGLRLMLDRNLRLVVNLTPPK